MPQFSVEKLTTLPPNSEPSNARLLKVLTMLLTSLMLFTTVWALAELGFRLKLVTAESRAVSSFPF